MFSENISAKTVFHNNVWIIFNILEELPLHDDVRTNVLPRQEPCILLRAYVANCFINKILGQKWTIKFYFKKFHATWSKEKGNFFWITLRIFFFFLVMAMTFTSVWIVDAGRVQDSNFRGCLADFNFG